MGTTIKSETTTTTEEKGKTVQQAQPTEAERAIQNIQVDQYRAYAPYQTEMYKRAFGLGSQLLGSFGSPESEQWKSLIGGVTPEQTQRMIGAQDRLLAAKLQQQGLYDSGTAYSSRLRAASDIANQNAQFNVGALQNALNLALGGQAQIQSPALGQSQQLLAALAGLRAQTAETTGVSATTKPLSGISLGIFGRWGGAY